MAWPPRRDRAHRPPAAVTGAVLRGHERLLAAVRIEPQGSWVLATSHAMAQVGPDGIPAWRRPWHEVDAASWSRDTSTLTVTWVDASRPVRWPLDDEPLFLQVVRERVQASVVVAEDVALPDRRTFRAAIRQDLSSGALLEQVVHGRGYTPGPDAETAAAVAFSRLREQVGMPARGAGPPG